MKISQEEIDAARKVYLSYPGKPFEWDKVLEAAYRVRKARKKAAFAYKMRASHIQEVHAAVAVDQS